MIDLSNATIGPPVKLPPGIVTGIAPPRDTGKARGKAKRSKYRAVPTVVDGIRFASKKEAKRYAELKLMLKAGEIEGLRLQVRYPLHSNGIQVGVYVADFCYLENGAEVVEDVKSGPTKTAVYRLKKKLMEAEYGIKIRET